VIFMENPSSSSSSPSELKQLQQQYDSLQQLVSSLMLVLIVISGTLSIFLLRQYKFVKSDLDGITPAATQLMTEYTNSYAISQDFARKLAEYGRTHPDFTPIMNKYRLADALAKPSTEAVTSSLPASVTLKKQP